MRTHSARLPAPSQTPVQAPVQVQTVAPPLRTARKKKTTAASTTTPAKSKAAIVSAARRAKIKADAVATATALAASAGAGLSSAGDASGPGEAIIEPLIPVPVPLDAPAPVLNIPPADRRACATSVLPAATALAGDIPNPRDDDASNHSIITVSDGDLRAPVDVLAEALGPALAANALRRFVANNGDSRSDYLTALRILTEEDVGLPHSGRRSVAASESFFSSPAVSLPLH